MSRQKFAYEDEAAELLESLGLENMNVQNRGELLWVVSEAIAKGRTQPTPPSRPEQEAACPHCKGTGEVAWEAGDRFSISPCGCSIGKEMEWFKKQTCDGRMIDHRGMIWLPINSIGKILALHAAHLRQLHDKEVAALKEALSNLWSLLRDPHNATESFERIGEMYYRSSGRLRPGKSEAVATGRDSNEKANVDQFNHWYDENYEAAYDAARTLLEADRKLRGEETDK